MEHHHDMSTKAVIMRYVRRRWRVPAQIGAILLGAGLLWLIFPWNLLPERVHADPAKPVKTIGEVQSLRQKAVGTPFAGPVKAINVRPGDAVKKGQVLFLMDDTGIRQALAAAQDERSMASAELKRLRSERAAELQALEQQVSVLRANIGAARQAAGESQVAMTEDGVIVELPAADPAEVQNTHQLLEQAQEQLRARKKAWEPALTEVQSGLRAAEERVRDLNRQLAEAVRRSPMDGVVTAVNAQAGQLAPAGSPLVRVDDPSGYRVVALVDEKVREELKPGAEVPLVRQNRTEVARLEKIESGWDKNLFQYWLWVKPSNPQSLKPGEQIEMTVPHAQVAGGTVSEM